MNEELRSPKGFQHDYLLTVRDVGDLPGVDKLLLATVVDFVVAGEEFLQLGLHVIVVDGSALALVSSHGSGATGAENCRIYQ